MLTSLSVPGSPARLAYSPAEAALSLGVSRQYVYLLMKRGELRYVQLGRVRRIPAVALHELLGLAQAEGASTVGDDGVN